jgi:hypothetical protein
MSREYWAEISKCSCSEESYEEYKKLEGMYLDYWQEKSILTEISLEAPDLEKPPIADYKKINLPSIKPNKIVAPRKLSAETDLRSPRTVNKWTIKNNLIKRIIPGDPFIYSDTRRVFMRLSPIKALKTSRYKYNV